MSFGFGGRFLGVRLHVVCFVFQINSWSYRLSSKINPDWKTAARLAQSVEHQTFNLRVKGSSPLLGAEFYKQISGGPFISNNTRQSTYNIDVGSECLRLNKGHFG